MVQARGAIMVASSPEILTRIAKVIYYSGIVVIDPCMHGLFLLMHVLNVPLLRTGDCCEQAFSRNAQTREDSRRRHGYGEGFISR